MDTVTLEGKEYVKASAIAKEFKYTSDYVGQLCRGKKVDARLVGRSWFVNPDSLRDHRKQKYAKQREEKMSNLTSSVISDTALKTKPERKKVSPVIKNKTMKALYDTSLTVSRVSPQGEKKLRVNYERDDEVLFPEITRKRTRPAKTLRVNPAGSKRLHVSANKTNISFEADELPEVALSGVLSVSGLEEASKAPEEQTKEVANNAKSSKSEAEKGEGVASNKVNKAPVKVQTSPKNIAITSKQRARKNSTPLKVKIRKPDATPRVSADNPKKMASSDNPQSEIRALFKESARKGVKKSPEQKSKVSTVSGLKTVNLASKQSSRRKTSLKTTPDANSGLQPVRISTAVLVSPLIASVLALVCATILFSASSNVTVDASEYRSELVLQMANLLELLR